MITIVKYGLGNIQAFANLYERLNIPVTIADTAAKLATAAKIVLPGVGAFDHAMGRLNASGMREVLDRLVLKERVPVLGICVGMQILAKSSAEGAAPGLGWIDGVVKRFAAPTAQARIQLPHMGWNNVRPAADNRLLARLSAESLFYFLHSYYFHCHNPRNVIAVTEYGLQFASAVNHANIYGVQFHPEKSHQNGIQLLKNFAEL
jgi:glutamine amidotransferase